MPSLTAVSAPARVELTSPTTTTTSGRASASTGSRRRLISPICGVAVGACTGRLTAGSGSSRFAKKAVRHRAVVVLTGMDQERARLGPRAELGHDGRDLHEIRAGPDDGRDLQSASPALSIPVFSSTSRAGPKRKSLRRRWSLTSVLPVLILWRTRVITPTRTFG